VKPQKKIPTRLHTVEPVSSSFPEVIEEDMSSRCYPLVLIALSLIACTEGAPGEDEVVVGLPPEIGRPEATEASNNGEEDAQTETPEGRTGTQTQALTGAEVPFDNFGSGGFAELVAPSRGANGFLGWQGPLRTIWGITFRDQALRLDNDKSNVNVCTSESKSGMAEMYWRSYVVPADGSYELNFDARPVRIEGTTYVHGSYWSIGDDARASLRFSAHASLTSPSAGSTTLYSVNQTTIASDATSTEERTKGFSRSITLPQGLAFTAKKGDSVFFRMHVRADTWARCGVGHAAVRVTRFGIETPYPQLVMRVASL
jgi:hypothetical protein